MKYAELVAADRRRAILLALYFAPGYTSPLMTLRELVEQAGYIASHDLMATEMAWLAEQGLVETTEQGAHRLTARGGDVAWGRAENPGVRKPGPGESPKG